MSIEWITYKNSKILNIKYTALTPEEMRNQIVEATDLLVATKSNENLVLTDMSNCFVNEDFMKLAKEQGKISLPHCKKSAIVGITGIKKLLLQGVNTVSSKPRIPFNSVEEAYEWLSTK